MTPDVLANTSPQSLLEFELRSTPVEFSWFTRGVPFGTHLNGSRIVKQISKRLFLEIYPCSTPPLSLAR
jgi:hypothetical protein